MGIIVSPTDWDDWRWGGTGVNPPGAPSAASLQEIRTGQWSWMFADQSYMAFPDQQLPHDYKEGTDLQPHIHFAPANTETIVGAWTLTLAAWPSAENGADAETLLTLTATFDRAVTAFQMQSIDFNGVLPGLGRKISSCLCATLSLSLTSRNPLCLVGLDAHYQKDRLGSKTITSKT